MSTQRGYNLSFKRPNNAMKIHSANRGFTLLELMIVMVIVAIGVALAVPSYRDVIERRETTSQAEQLSAFIAYAQSEAVKSNEMISVQLMHTNANDWCIGASEGDSGCDCTETLSTATGFCSLNGVAKIMSSATQTTSSMLSHTTDTTLVFDPVRGTMISSDLGTTHGFTLQSDNTHWALQVDIGVTGRIRICNPDSDKAVPGFKSCPSLGVTVISPPPIIISP